MILDESKMKILEHPLNYPIPASPEEIELIAIDIILAKDRRTRRAQRNYVLMHRKAERKLVPKINEWLDFMDKKLRAGLSRMRGRTPATMVKSIADWGEIRRHGEELIKPELMEILTEGGNAVMERRMVEKQARFDPIGIEAVNWVNTHGAELVVEITAETMQGIRDVITTGIQAGKSMPAIARELRPIVGLNSQYAGAVGKLHTSLIAEGVAAQKAAAQAERYAGRLHRRRTMTIARTETAFALSEGQRQGYKQMGVKNLQRVEDPDCCDICLDYDGRIYTIAEANGVLPEHPNCEGTWIMARGEIPTKIPTEFTPATTLKEAKERAIKNGVRVGTTVQENAEIWFEYIQTVPGWKYEFPGGKAEAIKKFKKLLAGSDVTEERALKILNGINRAIAEKNAEAYRIMIRQPIAKAEFGETQFYGGSYDFATDHINILYDMRREKYATGKMRAAKNILQELTTAGDAYVDSFMGTYIHEYGHYYTMTKYPAIRQRAADLLAFEYDRKLLGQYVSYAAKIGDEREMAAEIYSIFVHPDYKKLPTAAQDLINWIMTGEGNRPW